MARQNLTGAQNGTIQGAHGGTQQLGAAAQRRLGPNTAGGGLNPAPPTMDPAQKPPPWQALQQAGIGGQGSAAANRAAAAGLQPQAKPMALPGFQRLGGPPMAEDPISLPGGPGGPGPGDMPPGLMDLQGHAPNFGSGAMQGVGDAADQMQQHGGAPGAMQGNIGFTGPNGSGVIPAGGLHGSPLPGFTAAPGVTVGTNGGPLMSLPGPSGKFPPRPGLPTKPLAMPPDTPPTGVGGGIRPAGGGGYTPRPTQLPRNNMAKY
jgi:hypothetical protein